MVGILTKSAIRDILNGTILDSPVLQVVNHKQVNSPSQVRFRLMLSDGECSTSSAMLASQLNPLIENGEMDNNSIVKLKRYMLNASGGAAGKKILIILEIEVLQKGDEVGKKLGDPVQYDANQLQQPPQTATSDQRVPLGPRNIPNQTVGSTMPKAQPEGMPGIYPIAAVTPYQNKWTICARVTNKSGIRTWSNSRGEGKLFSMDLLDESGEIRATAFNDQVDKFHSMVEIDKVYYISQAQLKTANKQYSTLKNDYEMTFNQGTQLIPCTEEVSSIPCMQFEFVSIEQIESAAANSMIDVIGICRSVDDIMTFTSKNSGKEVRKRDIRICDDSGREINLTLWGTQAEEFDGTLKPVIAAKGVKVSDFAGKSLSLLSSSTLQINPDIRDAHKLRAWFDASGDNLSVQNLSGQRSSGGAFGENFKTLGQAVAEQLGSDQALYYSTKAYVSTTKQENCLYTACPAEGCNKKVVDMNNGCYRCEKCNKEHNSFEWRLMLQACIADGTGSTWITMFQEQAETILATTAAELASYRDNDSEAFEGIFSAVAFKEFLFKLRVKMEVYNDEGRLKTTVVGVNRMDAALWNKKLVEEIKKLMN